MSEIFEIKDKVAIVTGGASGIGLELVKELLRNRAKAVTIADTNKTSGEKTIKYLEEEFGANKVIFIEMNIADIKQFEDVFEETIRKFHNVDILINNAGIGNDSNWEKEISVNLNGTVHGMLLAMDKYLPKYKQGNEALILNTASIFGLDGYAALPVYSTTKAGILALTKCWGTTEHYEDTKVRVIAICPGATRTPMIADMSIKNIGERYHNIAVKIKSKLPFQGPDFVAEEAMKVMKYAANGSIWVIEAGELVYQYIFPDKETMKQNIL